MKSSLVSRQTGVSVEELTGGLGKYNRLIGEAANGSEGARQKLTRLRVDWRKAVEDNDYALGALFKRVNELPPGIARINAAQDAFGKSGARMVDLIESVGGNLAEFIKQERDAGLVLSEEDVAACDAFNDKLDELGLKAQLAAYHFGKELMPEITNALNDINAALGGNLGSWSDWGHSVARSSRACAGPLKV